MNHEHYMQRCIQLANLGSGNVAPNPLVGCVIVHDSKIIGEGYHQKYGSYHAEVNAIRSVKNKTLLPKSALYVTLEPCSHFGKTPPCTDFIIEHKIPEVFIGTKDIFPSVNGRGVKKLKQAGIKVVHGILEKECRYINRRFIVFHEKKRPYIILKWAQSWDGFIAPFKNEPGKKIFWISNEYSRVLVHKWRSEEASVMVGTNTALKDNPELNIRHWNGKKPVRIVMDKELILPSKLHLFDRKARTIIFTSNEKKSKENLEYVKINFRNNTEEQIVSFLHKQNIQSVIIEGGLQLLTSFIEKGLWDEARIFSAFKTLKAGVKAPAISGKIYSVDKIDNDTLTVLHN